jgi:hypothetical protein
MKNIIVTVICIVCAVFAVMAAVINSHPVMEISIDSHNNSELVISWNVTGSVKYDTAYHIISNDRHFSIERYIDGDINDSFIITQRHNTHVSYYSPVTSWNVLYIEFYRNIDEIFCDFTFGY